MFDAIAPRYDLLNRVLSAGLDRRWRDRAVTALDLPQGARVLDLCTGTADLAIATVRLVPGAAVVGVDFAGAMLGLGRAKVVSLGLDRTIQLVRGDATRVPVGTGTCDAATIAFGIRNVAEPERALTEIARVLRPQGRLAILEFGQPAIPGLRSLYSWYFAMCSRQSAVLSRSTAAPIPTCQPRWAPSRLRTSLPPSSPGRASRKSPPSL